MTAADLAVIRVTDEIVEVAARADHAHGRLDLAGDPAWDDLTDTDRDSYRSGARDYLAAAAPLVAAQALRSEAEALRAEIGSLWGIGDAVIHLLRCADELERGTDR